MATTRTPGITIDAEGNYFIDKCHRGNASACASDRPSSTPSCA
jgi:hypothetical protein